MNARWIALACLVGCHADAPPLPAPACGTSDALIAVSDYSSSGVGFIDVDGGGLLHFGQDLGKDPALAISRGRAFYVARSDSSTIFELDPSCGTALAGKRVSVND